MSSRVVASFTKRMRPARVRAHRHVDREHPRQQPRPWVSGRSIARRYWLARRLARTRSLEAEPQLHGLARRARGPPRHDLGASRRVRREHAVVAQHVEPRRRDQCHEPRHEIERLEHDGVRAVPPRPLEAIAQPPIPVLLEALLRERRASDVPAQPLDSLAIAPVDRRARMHVHAADVGERLARREHLADRTHELSRRLARSFTEELPVRRRRGTSASTPRPPGIAACPRAAAARSRSLAQSGGSAVVGSALAGSGLVGSERDATGSDVGAVEESHAIARASVATMVMVM